MNPTTRVNGHRLRPGAPTPVSPQAHLCLETQARPITAALVAEAIEEALGAGRPSAQKQPSGDKPQEAAR